jgi:hypothetical protein
MVYPPSSNPLLSGKFQFIHNLNSKFNFFAGADYSVWGNMKLLQIMAGRSG